MVCVLYLKKAVNKNNISREGEGVGGIGNLGLRDANYCLWNG